MRARRPTAAAILKAGQFVGALLMMGSASWYAATDTIPVIAPIAGAALFGACWLVSSRRRP